ncbi:MAG TPA: HAD family phosphatase [Anaerolineae bacterium]
MLNDRGEMQTQAVILDLDGLVVDSEPIHHRAFNAYLAQHGIDYQFDEDEYGRIFVGVPVKANAHYLVERFHLSFGPDQLLAEREAIYEGMIGDPRNLVPMPGLYTLLDKLELRGIVLGIASGSPRGQVETILHGMGIASRFRVVVAGSDVFKTKPAPDVYVRAVEKLGISKSSCMAVEDSASGVASAKSAGLRVVAVPNRYTRRQDLSAADLQVDNLEQVLPLVLDHRA